MENITDDLLIEFKQYTKISHDTEDEYLKNLLKKSYSNLVSRFGEFDIYENLEGQDLVFARSRYAYEDLLEYFNDNYQDDLISFGLNNVIGSVNNENNI
ncbi:MULTISPECIES: phage head-tail adapter protein [Staphylococcus]|uniref:Phage head-tail adapter protein n=1 Tax=Staphylococcus petrasii TaxID=1276936 RepID=A0ABY2KX43_9STAP|nr:MULTISPECIES: phage head-tail adapter protein [Staphylococcus]KQC20242.1 phage head-tail adapter protein [Staphylococcus haemolyticus]PNY86752.1 phage head-tail adapter protein [Staphylococcus haemolyticus]QCY38744.1 phage head-tail adapter protein [Staphylococcus haemolyticus]QXA66050.1 phage head-tail adapter protein [Staphylococcus haemolyticus]TGE15244.1 phage head-tail adapter protein [Staphylococcus petrasii]